MSGILSFQGVKMKRKKKKEKILENAHPYPPTQNVSDIKKLTQDQ
jgi:hypothetical protein